MEASLQSRSFPFPSSIKPLLDLNLTLSFHVEILNLFNVFLQPDAAFKDIILLPTWQPGHWALCVSSSNLDGLKLLL